MADDCDNVDDAARWGFSAVDPFITSSAARVTSSVLIMSPEWLQEAFFCLLRLKIVKWARVPPWFNGFVELSLSFLVTFVKPPSLPEHSLFPPFAQLARRGHPSIHLGSQTRVEPPEIY